MDWKNLLEDLSNNGSIKESEVLVTIPQELHSHWDNYMRGKTCPIMDNKEHGVYSHDLLGFLNKCH